MTSPGFKGTNFSRLEGGADHLHPAGQSICVPQSQVRAPAMSMITSTLLRPVPRRTPMIVGVFCFRYDAALVPALISNITPLVHGIVALDDRNNGIYAFLSLSSFFNL